MYYIYYKWREKFFFGPSVTRKIVVGPVLICDTMTVMYGLGFDHAVGAMKSIYRLCSTAVGIMGWAKQVPMFCGL